MFPITRGTLLFFGVLLLAILLISAVRFYYAVVLKRPPDPLTKSQQIRVTWFAEKNFKTQPLFTDSSIFFKVYCHDPKPDSALYKAALLDVIAKDAFYAIFIEYPGSDARGKHFLFNVHFVTKTSNDSIMYQYDLNEF